MEVESPIVIVELTAQPETSNLMIDPDKASIMEVIGSNMIFLNVWNPVSIGKLLNPGSEVEVPHKFTD